MSKVYFLKDFSKLKQKTKDLLEGFYLPDFPVITKIHFGEPGNKSAFTTSDIRPIVEALASQSLKAILLDTPVLYSSPRNSVEGYSLVVREKGYDKLADFIISDRFAKIKTKDFMAEVSKELIEAKNVLVISHVKGHICSGFGGAIKNLGMGGVSRKTKEIEHTLSKPKFIAPCHGCGICAASCPAKAIEIVDGKAKINLEDCIGCSICQEKCSYKCLVPESVGFDDLLAQGASAVINNFSEKVFYINFLKNIVKNCDCASDPGGIISGDIGILFSDNPIAIDKASVDLVNQVSGKDLFQEVHAKNPLLHLEFAKKYTGKDWDYELIEI